MNLEMRVSELSKRERIVKEKRARILKEMEDRVKTTPYIEFNDDVKNILGYIYDKCNRKGQVCMTMRDIVRECNLYHLGEDKESITEEVKGILFDLEWDVLSSIDDLIGVTDEHYDELIILEVIDEFR